MMFNGKHRQSVPGPLCANFAPLLPVLDDLTDTRLAHDTRAHLAECPWCRAQRATYDRFDAALRLHFAPDAVPILSDNMMRTLMSDSQDNAPPVAPETASAEEDGDVAITVSPLPIPPQSPKTPKRSWRLVTGAAGMAAVLVLSLLAGLIFVSHGRPQAPSTNKQATHAPGLVPGSQISLMAIGMSSPADGWAFSESTSDTSGIQMTALHYTNGRWAEVQTGIKASIEVVKMLSPTDGWAIGSSLYHYDGTNWQNMNVGDLGVFQAVSAVSPTNIWIAGTGYGNQPLIAHYDGHTWTPQSTPNIENATLVSITSIAMVSATEGWAVGAATRVVDNSNTPNGNGNTSQTGVVLHFSENAWHLARTLPNSDLRTIAMVSANEGWFGGEKQLRNASFPAIGPVWSKVTLWHYTDGRWIETSPPQSVAAGDTTPLGLISNITMFSATDGWLFASLSDQPQASDGSIPLSPSVFHLEHGHWVQVKTPTFQGRIGVYMRQVSFISPDEFWGVGTAISTDGTPAAGGGSLNVVTPLIVHYKNGSWDVIES